MHLPQPIHDLPALLVRTGAERLLAVCDLHLGIEEKYRLAGADIKPATTETAQRILTVALAHDVDRLVIAGDIKHTIPWTTLMESREVPRFFEVLAKGVSRFELIIGNHDARLKELFTRKQRLDWGVRFHNECFCLEDFAFVHGHKWPPGRVFTKQFVILAHNHPSVELPQGIGMSLFRPCWVRGSVVRKNVEKHYKGIKAPEGQEAIIMPSVLGETRGTPFNSRGVRLLGPVLANKLVDMDDARLFLLDGTELGRIKDLRT